MVGASRQYLVKDEARPKDEDVLGRQCDKP